MSPYEMYKRFPSTRQETSPTSPLTVKQLVNC